MCYRPNPEEKSMPENISNTLLAVAGTLLGVTIGILGTYFVSVHLARKHTKTIAAQRLRDAFAPEVVKLQHLEDYEYSQVQDILKAAFDKHQMAINEFGFLLNNDKLKTLTMAWREYCTVGDVYCYFQQYDKDPKTAIDRIQAIIALTRE
jgi:hypothetical protein